MKKNMLLMLFVLIVVGAITLESKYIIRYIELSNDLYEELKENNLVSVDGNVNLVEVISERDNLYNDIIELFDEEYDKNNYMKIIEDIRNDNLVLDNEIKNLSNEITTLENSKKSLNEQYNTLKKKYNNLNSNMSNSSNSYNFPLINQYPKYQTGCESVSLTMLLNYYGVNVTVEEIIANLKKGSLPYYEDGILYGGNPELEFVGNPYSKNSYGVYQIPIAEVANIYKSGINVRSNFEFNEVLNIVKMGTPVMVWTSMGLSLPYISNSWIYKPTMETIYWKANEHAVVVVGVEGNNVVIADPIGGKLKRYSITLFNDRYNYYGKKALYYYENI